MTFIEQYEKGSHHFNNETFDGVNAEKMELNVSLTEVTFDSCNFSNAKMFGKIYSVIFKNCDLRDFDMTECWIFGEMEFIDCKVSGIKVFPSGNHSIKLDNITVGFYEGKYVVRKGEWSGKANDLLEIYPSVEYLVENMIMHEKHISNRETFESFSKDLDKVKQDLDKVIKNLMMQYGISKMSISPFIYDYECVGNILEITMAVDGSTVSNEVGTFEVEL